MAYQTLIKTLDITKSRYGELFNVPPEGSYHRANTVKSRVRYIERFWFDTPRVSEFSSTYREFILSGVRIIERQM